MLFALRWLAIWGCTASGQMVQRAVVVQRLWRIPSNRTPSRQLLMSLVDLATWFWEMIENLCACPSSDHHYGVPGSGWVLDPWPRARVQFECEHYVARKVRSCKDKLQQKDPVKHEDVKSKKTHRLIDQNKREQHRGIYMICWFGSAFTV